MTNISAVSALRGLGYQSLGEAGVPGRHYFRLRGPVSINLHIEHWATNIALRDYLRADADARTRYAAAKRSAVAAGARTLLAYSDAKACSVASLVKEACARMAARDE